MARPVASLGRLAPKSAALLVCDVQERFRPIISNFPAVVDASKRMMKAAKALDMPILVTEQYPKALGATVPELQEVLPEGCKPIAKTNFSMCVDEVKQQLQSKPDIKQVLLLGIEAHVCVFQTTLDLLEQGYEVHLLVDGISSQRLTDRAAALQRLSQIGAFIATTDMVMFQLVQGSTHPAFKAISALAKEERPSPLPPPTASSL